MASDRTSASHSEDRNSKGSSPKKVVRIGKYEVFQHVATGGMGVVYKARDCDTNRVVAIKILPKELAQKPLILERFKREAKSAAKLRHENVVSLLDSGEYRGTFYLVMEFVEGVDLYTYVQKHGPLSPEEARQIVLQATRALRHADEMGIVHRDVKPSNFLLRWQEGLPIVKLLDFGLARDYDDDQWRVTRAGTTVGTIDYVSPEQARDSGSADVRSDLYSLGATWFYLLAGQAMFPGGAIANRLVRLLQEEPPDLRLVNPRVSDATWTVMSRLLAKKPEDRHQTADELIAALEELEGKASVDPSSCSETDLHLLHSTEFDLSTDEPPKQRQLTWYLLVGFAVVALLVGTVLIVKRPGAPPAVQPAEILDSNDGVSQRKETP